jgi:hypothetical protein
MQRGGGRGGFRGGGRGGFGGRGGGRDGGGRGFGGRGGGFGGGRGSWDAGPPAEVVEAGIFEHPCEGEAVCKLAIEKVREREGGVGWAGCVGRGSNRSISGGRASGRVFLLCV